MMRRGARAFAYNFAINSLCKLSIEHEANLSILIHGVCERIFFRNLIKQLA